MDYPRQILDLATAQPYPLVFATISGAHLYGFPSPDSDFDLRGMHVLPITDAIGLDPGRETIEVSGMRGEIEVDLVTHDARKYLLLLLKKDGSVLEQVYSPLVLRTTPEHEELKAITRSCITRHHMHHYRGFAETQWKLFEKQQPRRVKPLLYVYRVLLTGIHLMRTGEVEANLLRLIEHEPLAYVPELVSRKLTGGERSALGESDFAFHQGEYARLQGVLQAEFERSALPENAAGRAALNDLLIRLRGCGS
jgi:uncharacterized protein